MNEYEPNLMLQNIVQQPNKPNKLVMILYGVIAVLILIIILLLVFNKPKEIVTETERLESLDEVSLELESFIDENEIDALDAFGDSSLLRVAINKICTGVYNCKEISGDEVEKYIQNVFNQKVTLSDVSCDINDGVLYTYDATNNKFVLNDSHASHINTVTKPIYTKVNSIKRKDDKILLVLNKLYYNPEKSDYITTDPLGINAVYNAKNYMHTTDKGEDIDLTKITANYENNFSNLKNTGTRYSYTFGKKDGHYVVEKYDVISDED